MPDDNSHLVARSRALAAAAGAFVFLAAALMLAGWLLGIDALRGPALGAANIKFNTALCLLMAGASLWLVARREVVPGLAAALPLLVALVGLATLAEYLFQLDLGIDQLLIREANAAAALPYPGRMAPNTAADVAMIGLGLLLLGWGKEWAYRAGQLLSIGAAAIALVALIGYIYGVSPWYGSSSDQWTGMTLYTAMLFLMLATGVLICRPGTGLMGIFGSPGAGGAMARRLLVAAIFAPLAVGVLVSAAQDAGAYSPQLETAVYTVFAMGIFALLVTLISLSLDRADTARRNAESELRQAHKELQTAAGELEARVEERTRAVAEANASLVNQAAMLSEQASLLNLTHDAIMVRDLDARIRFWNQGAVERYGWTADEILGRRSHDVLQTRFPAPPDEIYEELVSRGQWEGELIHTTRDGRGITVLSRWALLPAHDGRPAEVMEINNDITLRVRAEEEVLKLNEELRAAAAELEGRVAERTSSLQDALRRLAASNKELEAFSYSVSHDLRAPLRAIDGFSRILMEEYAQALEPDAREYLQLVRDNTQQMGRLIDDLLAFSRLGRSAMQKQAVDLREIAEQALADLHAECEGRSVETHIGDLPVCEADPSLLRQVFVNLFANALKFTRTRPVAQIEVGAWQEDAAPPGEASPDEAVIFVRDNGIGFDMRYAEKLFGVFQRLHRAEDYEGTGVGLALVQRIINRHGGRVWAEGAVDKGATFYFTLPGGDGNGARSSDPARRG